MTNKPVTGGKPRSKARGLLARWDADAEIEEPIYSPITPPPSKPKPASRNRPPSPAAKRVNAKRSRILDAH